MAQLPGLFEKEKKSHKEVKFSFPGTSLCHGAHCHLSCLLPTATLPQAHFPFREVSEEAIEGWGIGVSQPQRCGPLGWIILCCGVVLRVGEYGTAAQASTHEMPAAPLPRWDSQQCLQTLPGIPWRRPPVSVLVGGAQDTQS